MRVLLWEDIMTGQHHFFFFFVAILACDSHLRGRTAVGTLFQTE